jgi:hypothetical protein
MFRVGHKGEGIDDDATLEVAREIYNDYPVRIVQRIIDAASAEGWRPEQPGPPTFVMEISPLLDSIPER